jgi:hypothetical protein
MVMNDAEPIALAGRAAETVREALSELCAAGLVTVVGPRKVEGVDCIDVEPARPGAARMQLEVYDEPPSMALLLGEHRLVVELLGSEQEMLEDVRELVGGVALHGYEEWIRATSDDCVAGVADARTASGRRRMIANNVAPWPQRLRRPGSEPRSYVPYSADPPTPR